MHKNRNFIFVTCKSFGCSLLSIPMKQKLSCAFLPWLTSRFPCMSRILSCPKGQLTTIHIQLKLSNPYSIHKDASTPLHENDISLITGPQQLLLNVFVNRLGLNPETLFCCIRDLMTI